MLILCVDIAKGGAVNSVQKVLDRTILSKDTHEDQVVLGSITARGQVLDGDGTGDLKRLPQVHRLPKPVDTVDHSMMKEKRGIGG